jgi:hypothetical protein
MQQAAPGKWVEEFNRPRPLYRINRKDAGVDLIRKADRLEVIAGGKGVPMESMLYQLSTRRWIFRNVGVSDDFTRWAYLGNDENGRALAPVTGIYFAASSDHGVTWQKRGDKNWAKGSLLFTSKDTGYMVRTDSNAAFVAENVELSLWHTVDAGVNWTQAGRMPGMHGMLVALDAAAGLGDMAVNGRFYVSADGGRSWRLERQVR